MDPHHPRRRSDSARSAALGLATNTPVLGGSRRGYAAALVDARRKSADGARALLARRLEILRDTLGELRAVGRVMRHAGLRESLVHLDDLARGAFELALSNVRDLALLAAATQKEALQILTRRLQDDLDEFKRQRSQQNAPRSA